MKESVIWKIMPFSGLLLEELYEIIKLRVNVFIVEQNCPYPELDDKDLVAFHQLGLHKGTLVAYSRLLPPGVSYKEASIGRVVIKENFRNQGLGHEMLRISKEFINKNLDHTSVKLSAQSHLTGFYEKHGFANTGKNYLEDGIPHTEMLLIFKNLSHG